MTGQEPWQRCGRQRCHRRQRQAEGGRRRNIDAVVTGASIQLGRRRRALHVEHVGPGPKLDVERFELVVIDAFDAPDHDRGARLHRISPQRTIDREGGGEDIACDVRNRQHAVAAGRPVLGAARKVDQVGQRARDAGMGLACARHMAYHQAARSQAPIRGARHTSQGDQRRCSEERAVTAHHHQRRAFGKCHEVGRGIQVDVRGQARGDVGQGIGRAHGKAVVAGGRTDLEIEFPTFAGHRHAAEKRRHLGRGGAVDRADRNRAGSPGYGQAGVERAAAAGAVDDDQHSTIGGRRQQRRAVGVHRIGQDARDAGAGIGHYVLRSDQIAVAGGNGMHACHPACGDAQFPDLTGVDRQTIQVDRGGTAAAVERRRPYLPGLRLAGGGDGRRGGEYRAVAAHDQHGRAFGDGGEVGIGTAVDRRGEALCDRLQAGRRTQGAGAYGVAVGAWRDPGDSKRDAPHLAHRRLARQVDGGLGGCRAVDHRRPQVGATVDREAGLEHTTVAVDDHQHVAIGGGCEGIGRVAVDQLRQFLSGGAVCGVEDMGAGHTAQADGEAECA